MAREQHADIATKNAVCENAALFVRSERSFQHSFIIDRMDPFAVLSSSSVVVQATNGVCQLTR